MLRLTILGLTAFAASPVLAQSLNYDGDIVQAECSAEWGTEYDMVKFCMDQRRDGFAVYQLTIAGLSASLRESFSATALLCEREWQQEWDMTEHCMRENMQAAASIPNIIANLPEDVGTGIVRGCMGEWGDELTMVAYCMTQRAEGWRAINN